MKKNCFPISKTDNEELLQLLKEDFKFYSKMNNTDITDNLCPKQLQELKVLAEEDEIRDTHKLDEFKKVTDRWRTR